MFGIIPIATFLSFLTLKLAGHLKWSWWWVTSPLWLWAIFFTIAVILRVRLTIQRQKTLKSFRTPGR